MKKIIHTLIAAIVLLNSCAKTTEYIPNVTDSVSSGSIEGTKWKMASVILGQEINGQKVEQDLYPLVDACSKDDLMLFNKGNIFIYDAGATKCESSEPQQENGSWSLSADKKKLTLTSESINNTPEAIVYDVVVTSTKLTLTYRESTTVTTGGQELTTTIYTIFSFAPHN